MHEHKVHFPIFAEYHNVFPSLVTQCHKVHTLSSDHMTKI